MNPAYIKRSRQAFFIMFSSLLLLTSVIIGPACRAGSKELTKEDIYTYLRNKMVDTQIRDRNIKDTKLIEAMRTVPRHRFIPEEYRNQAYDDTPVLIGEGQTISQPIVVALMTENLELTGSEKVLEIGTGSGYQTAVLAEIAKDVYTVEIIDILHLRSNKILSDYENIKTSNHDGYYGWKNNAPYDRIIVTAAPDHIPQPLLDQLRDGGIMVIPVGPPGWNQVLWKITKENGEIRTTIIADVVVFVELTRTVSSNNN